MVDFKRQSNDNNVFNQYKKSYKNKISTKFENKFKLAIIAIIIIFMIEPILLCNLGLLIKYKSSNITLKIRGIGSKKIFSSELNYPPDFIYINNKLQSNVSFEYNFNRTENFVKLVWNNEITNCENMFYECKDITEMDLSNFDSSNVNGMTGMFRGCSSLTSINLFNFDTSQVIFMGQIFYGCSSLTSLDLSSFNFTNVEHTDNMFNGCSSLTSINLINFVTPNLKGMGRMFQDCSSLTSLDLSSFDTSNVVYMDNLFSGCKNLEYINLKQFITNEDSDCQNMFEGLPNNLVVCLSNSDQKIYRELITTIKCFNQECSDNWKLKQKKIILETNECINNCEEDTLYKYE